MKLTKYPNSGMIDSDLKTFKVKKFRYFGIIEITRVLFTESNELLEYEYGQIADLYDKENSSIEWIE